MTEKEKRAAQKFLDLMLQVTFRLCHWSQDGVLKSRSSGFLYQKSESSPILVITAGHKTPPEGSFIETTRVYQDKTAIINAGKFNVFYQQGGVDYAYSELPIELIQNILPSDVSLEFKCYKEPFVNAVKDEVYGFAVRNNFEFVKMGNTLAVPQYLCYELYLELEKQEKHINYFKPSRPIQEHEYYAGASGSPIADPSGKICSLLIGGTDPRKFLRAFRLDNIELP